MVLNDLHLPATALERVTDLADRRFFEDFVRHQRHVELAVLDHFLLFFVKLLGYAVQLLLWLIRLFVRNEVRQRRSDLTSPVEVLSVESVNLSNFHLRLGQTPKDFIEALPVWLPQSFEVRGDQVKQVKVTFKD